MHQNVEIKASCKEPANIRNWIREHNGILKGTDHQVDTYFRVVQGRLKLRQGNIENALIYYERENTAQPKLSKVVMTPLTGDTEKLKEVLTASNGIKVVVNKQREIWFIDNVKFHIDQVDGLGGFVEIEAIDADGSLGFDHIQQQCNFYMQQFNILPEHLLTHSYSDLLLK